MTMLGLLGAAAGGVGEGMQRRRKEQAAVDLRMLDQKLSVELAKQQRAWDQADLQEGRSYNEGQLEKFSATLPPGVVAVPSGMKVTDTRQKRGGGGGGAGSSGKLSGMQREQLKELREMRTNAQKAYSESTDPAVRERETANWTYANNKLKEFTGIGLPSVGADAGSGQPAPERDKDSFFSPFGVGTKEEAKGGGKGAKEKPAEKSTDLRENYGRLSGFGDVEKPAPKKEDPKERAQKERRASRKAAQKQKHVVLESFMKTKTYQDAQSGNARAQRSVRAKLETMRKGADLEMIKKINRILSGM